MTDAVPSKRRSKPPKANLKPLGNASPRGSGGPSKNRPETLKKRLAPAKAVAKQKRSGSDKNASVDARDKWIQFGMLVDNHMTAIEEEREWRRRASIWIPLTIIFYTVWILIMTSFMLSLPVPFLPQATITEEATLPLTVTIIGTTAFAVGILVPILSGIYRHDRKNLDWHRMFSGILGDHSDNN